MRMLPGKRLAIPQRLAHSGDDPPVRFRLPRRRQKAALTGDPPLRVGDRAILLAPGQRRKADVGETSGIGLGGDIRDDHQRTGGQRLAHRVAVRERHHRVGTHDPDRFDLAAANGGKQLHGGQPGGLRQPFRPPEAGQPLQIVWHKIHVRRQHRRQPADFAAAHGVGLTGQRKGAAAAAAILPAGQMDVDDGVTFVAAAGGLIDSHGVEGDRPRGGDELAIESRHLIGRQTAKGRHPRHVPAAGGGQRLRAVAKAIDAGSCLSQGVKQPRKQPAVASRGQRQMAVGDLAGSGASGVDRHDPQSGIIPLRLRQPLEQHRMRPGGVRADQHHQIAVFHILIATGHHVGAKGPLVAGHRRRHA